MSGRLTAVLVGIFLLVTLLPIIADQIATVTGTGGAFETGPVGTILEILPVFVALGALIWVVAKNGLGGNK